MKKFNIILPDNNGYRQFDLISWIKNEQDSRKRYKIKTKEKFEIMLKSMFWSRAEYEFMMAPLFSDSEDKIDVYCLFIEPNLELIWQICIDEKIIKQDKDDDSTFNYDISAIELGNYNRVL